MCLISGRDLATDRRAYRTIHNGQFSPAPVVWSSGRDRVGPARFGPPRFRGVPCRPYRNGHKYISFHSATGGRESVAAAWVAREARDRVTPSDHLRACSIDPARQ